MRLNRFLAEAGVCSRRAADRRILAGEVLVNGRRAELGISVDPEQDEVEFLGRKIKIPGGEKVYYALNKPKGVISTAADQSGRKTVLLLVPESPRVYPAGRLDADSDGLIILTNDGELTQKITHPGFLHQKEYLVKCRSENFKNIPSDLKKIFEKGIAIDGKLMKADRVFDISLNDPGFVDFKIVLHTGYNRQIRRMCAKIGLKVSALTRIRMGKLNLKDLNLKPGEYRAVKKEQIL